MSILHVVPRLYPQGQSGTEIHAWQLCCELAKRGEKTSIFTLLSDSTVKQFALKKKQKDNVVLYFFEVPHQDTKQRLLKHLLLYKPLLLLHFIKILSLENISLVHFHHLLNLSKVLPLLCFFKRIPTIIDLADYWYICPTAHLQCNGSLVTCASSCIWEEPKSVITSVLRKLKIKIILLFYGILAVTFHRLWWRFLLKNIVSYSLGISQRTVEIYKKNGFTFRNVSVLPWGILPFSVKHNFQKSITVGYIGTVMPIKGIEVLLKAFNKITTNNINLNIYGHSRYAPSEISNLKTGNHRIAFMGDYDHEEIPVILSNIDILVVPSIWEEPYGLVVQEGLTANLPVIASKIGGIPEQIKHGINGYLFTPNDEKDLQSILEYVLTNYSKVCRSLNYTMQRTISDEAGKLSTIYQDLGKI